MSFSFTNVPGASFTVYCATNLTAPINWQAIGSPNEISSGSYKFTDAGGHQSFALLSGPKQSMRLSPKPV